MAESELKGDESKKSSKKMIIIAALVLSIAGGGAGYYFMQKDSVAEEGDEPSKPVEEAEEEETEAEEEEEVGDEDFYYDLAQPLIVNFPKGSAANLVQVSVAFLVKGEGAETALKKHEPMVRNYLLMAISAKSPTDLMSTEGKKVLRADMLDKTRDAMMKVVGKRTVDNIFFTAFVMQ
jgi:flagellar FliL protein